MARDDAPARLREGVDGQVRALDWVVPAVLESVIVENAEMLGEVRELGDDRDPIDGIPIWTPYAAGDEYGHEQALDPPERGLMICGDYPLETARQETEPPYNADLERGRHHAFQDGFFLPGVRVNGERGLGSPLGADWLRHPSETERRFAENGDFTVEHHAGHTVHVGSNEVRVAFERPDGDTMTVTVTEQDTTFEGPDEFKEFREDPRITMGVSDDGTSTLGGRSTIGDTDANRVDRATEETDPESPYTYEQVDETADPIIDPTDDGETQYDNPAMAALAGPVDGSLYEARRLIPWERREEDPDPTVTDPTDPAFIELPDRMRQQGELPAYTPWINTTEQVAKWWRDGAPEVIFP